MLFICRDGGNLPTRLGDTWVWCGKRRGGGGGGRGTERTVSKGCSSSTLATFITILPYRRPQPDMFLALLMCAPTGVA
jgi:hypothetical protein